MPAQERGELEKRCVDYTLAGEALKARADGL